MTETATLRPFRGTDLRGVLEVLKAAYSPDAGDRSLFVRRVLLDPNFDPAGAPVACLGGDVAGFGLALLPRAVGQVRGEDLPGYITLLAVQPKCTRRGMGSALLEWCEAYLRSNGAARCLISPYPHGYLMPGVDVHAHTAGLEFLIRRGYRVVSRPVSMECDLDRLATPPWVEEREQRLAADGITFHGYRPDLVPELLGFLREEFSDDWQRFARSAVERIETGDRPDRLQIAQASGKVLGFSHYEGERFGPIGVRPMMQGQGIGHVLMFRTLRSMRGAGFHTAWFLWSDDRTAGRLYASAGFRVKRRFAVLRKELRD